MSADEIEGAADRLYGLPDSDLLHGHPDDAVEEALDHGPADVVEVYEYAYLALSLVPHESAPGWQPRGVLFLGTTAQPDVVDMERSTR